MLGQIIIFTTNGVKKEGVCFEYITDDFGRAQYLHVEVNGQTHKVYPANYIGIKPNGN